MNNLPELLQQAVAQRPDKRFLRWVPPENPKAEIIDYSYEAFETLVRQCLTVLMEAGLKAGDRLLFFAENSPLWQAMFLAAQTLRLQSVAIFASLGKKDVADIFSRVQPKALFLTHQDHWEKVRPNLQETDPLKLVVSERNGVAVKEGALLCLDPELLKVATPISQSRFRILIHEVQASDPFLMIFTSGTTGRQKGVRLTQGNLVSALAGGEESVALSPEDSALLVLPFAHIAGQPPFYMAIRAQGEVILCSHRDDILRGFSLGPTYTLLVPFFYEKIWRTLLEKVERLPKPMRKLAHWSIEHGMDHAMARRMVQALLGKPLRRKLGGKIHTFVAGGATSDPRMERFYQTLGFEYLDYYGMSETSGIIALSRQGDRERPVESPGKPWRDNEVKIAQDSEILIKGKTVMAGYLEKEDQQDAFDAQGYFHTGDLGYLDDAGYLFITGRKKNLMVLSTGKKIAVEPIEQKIAAVLPVHGVVLLKSGAPFVAVALWMDAQQKKQVQNQEAKNSLEKILLKKIHQVLSGFSEYEIPKRVLVLPGEPADTPELLTPTLKLKRGVFLKQFAKQIDELYGVQSQ